MAAALPEHPQSPPRSRAPAPPARCHVPIPAPPASWHARLPSGRASLAHPAPPTPAWPPGPRKGSSGSGGRGPRVPQRCSPAARGHRHGPSPADGNRFPPRLPPTSGHWCGPEREASFTSHRLPGRGPPRRRGERSPAGPPVSTTSSNRDSTNALNRRASPGETGAGTNSLALSLPSVTARKPPEPRRACNGRRTRPGVEIGPCFPRLGGHSSRR